MSYLLGFLIALCIALTGVGAGTITVPVLVLFLNVPAALAVGIGLTFAAAVKAILAPAQLVQGNVSWRTLGFMLLGGVPGVLVGSLLLRHLVVAGLNGVLNAILGAILVGTASWQIFSSFRPMWANRANRDRTPLLSWLMFAVGAEVGFSSAGAGALGSAALLSLTPLEPVQVVGTDILFGFTVSLLGGGAHWLAGSSNLMRPGNLDLLMQLIGGGLCGAIVGTLVSSRIPRRPLRFALWLWLLILGGIFLFNSYHAWAAMH
ncbi:MAG TPA: sulfite exporter TauE/SafE family protein [Terracidiphilus sp.]|nr:sulfite exporter TauE/SafE family protein [Terracidiphilus sp.]